MFNVYVYPKDKDIFKSLSKKDKRKVADVFHEMLSTYAEKVREEKEAAKVTA